MSIKKIKGRAGFSLAETLMALLILLLVSTIVATGIPVARNAYEKVVLAANAEILLSTTVAALRDELGTATDVRIENNPIGTENVRCLNYYSADTRATSRIYLGGDEKRTIMLWEYAPDVNLEALGIETSTPENEAGRPLVTLAASSGDAMYATFTDFSVSGDSVIFSDLKVLSKSGATLAELGTKQGSESEAAGGTNSEPGAATTSDLIIRIYSAKPTPTAATPGTSSTDNTSVP